MQQWAMDGRETIALRGYKNQSLSSRDGSLMYNKFTFELRYPITLKPSASIFALSFLESGNGYDSFRDFNPFNSKRSAGMGVRIFMPAFGLLGIDLVTDLTVQISAMITNGWENSFYHRPTILIILFDIIKIIFQCNRFYEKDRSYRS